MSSELRVDKIMPVDGIGNDTSHVHGNGNTSVQYGGGVLSSWTITELDGAQVTHNQTDVTLDT